MDKKLFDDALLLLENSIDEYNYDFEDYLFYITTYLVNLEDKSVLSKYISKIKKAISQLEKSFDEDYLLIKSYEEYDEVFFEKLNHRFLNYSEDLGGILDEFDYMNLAEKLSDLRTKVLLGYERYFVQLGGDEKVAWFSPKHFDFELETKFDFDKETEVSRILSNLIESKDKKKFDFIEKYLFEFPRMIYIENNKNKFEIQKSLFFNEEFDSKEFEEESVILQDLASVEIACLIINFFNSVK